MNSDTQNCNIATQFIAIHYWGSVGRGKYDLHKKEKAGKIETFYLLENITGLVGS